VERILWKPRGTLWLVKEVTSTGEVVTTPIKQSKNGQSKNTTSNDGKIAACEAVKICLAKMTAQRGSQFVISLKFVPLYFLSSIYEFYYCFGLGQKIAQLNKPANAGFYCSNSSARQRWTSCPAPPGFLASSFPRRFLSCYSP
jgi:hypothetical protein